MAAIVSPVASALDGAQAAGLVHRDVKPANMLLDVRQGRPDHVYLGDFGISKQMLSAAGLTETGSFLGTADYCAPEQIQGLPVDGRTDQYALACTVFELLTGLTPFRRDDAPAVIWAQMTETPPPLTSQRAGLPPAVDGVVAKALAKRPEIRYATCREFAEALRATLGLCLPGSLVERTTRCGSPQCRCHTDPSYLHGPYPSWIRKAGTRTITRTLSPAQLERYRPLFDNTKRLRELIGELETLSAQAVEHAEGWEAP